MTSFPRGSVVKDVVYHVKRLVSSLSYKIHGSQMQQSCALCTSAEIVCSVSLCVPTHPSDQVSAAEEVTHHTVRHLSP